MRRTQVIAVALLVCASYIAAFLIIVRPINGIRAVSSPGQQRAAGELSPPLLFASTNPSVNRVCGLVFWPLIKVRERVEGSVFLMDSSGVSER